MKRGVYLHDSQESYSQESKFQLGNLFALGLMNGMRVILTEDEGFVQRGE